MSPPAERLGDLRSEGTQVKRMLRYAMEVTSMQHQVHCGTWGRSCTLCRPEEVIESVLDDFSAAGPVRCWEQVFRLVYPVVKHLWEHLGKEGRIELNRMNPAFLRVVPMCSGRFL